MAIFSSKEIESQYNLIKMLLSDKKSTQRQLKQLKQLKKDISYMPIELKKKLKKENIFYREKRVKMVSIWLVFYNLKNYWKI